MRKTSKDDLNTNICEAKNQKQYSVSQEKLTHLIEPPWTLLNLPAVQHHKQ